MKTIKKILIISLISFYTANKPGESRSFSSKSFPNYGTLVSEEMKDDLSTIIDL
jgi:hypothetical protein